MLEALTVTLIIGEYLGNKGAHFAIEFVSAIAEVIAIVFAMNLTVLENNKSVLSSNVLLVYWSLFIISTGVRLRTLTIGCPAYDPEITVMYAGKLGLSLMVLILECVRKDRGIRLGDDDAVS